MQDIFGKIANAAATKGGNSIRDGKYRLIIEKMVLNTGHNGTCFIPEFRVKTATATEKDVEPSAVGSTVSSVWNVTKHSSAPGNVKAFVLAVLGLDEASTPAAKVQEYLQQAVGPEQILRGIEVDCTTVRRVNQGRDNPANRGQTMTLPTWQHVSGQTQESVMANRAALEGAPAPAPAQAAPTGAVLGNILRR